MLYLYQSSSVRVFLGQTKAKSISVIVLAPKRFLYRLCLQNCDRNSYEGHWYSFLQARFACLRVDSGTGAGRRFGMRLGRQRRGCVSPLARGLSHGDQGSGAARDERLPLVLTEVYRVFVSATRRPEI